MLLERLAYSCQSASLLVHTRVCGRAFEMQKMTVSSRRLMTLSVTKERSEILLVAWLSHHDASPAKAR